MCRVLNKHVHGLPASAEYIGRGSKWGNRFVIGRDGDRATVIAKHERDLADRHDLLRVLDELRGRDLVCFCAPQPCHGDLLRRLANASREERIAWWRGVKAAICEREARRTEMSRSGPERASRGSSDPALPE